MRKIVSFIAAMLLLLNMPGTIPHDHAFAAQEESETTQPSVSDKSDNSPSDAVIIITVLSVFTISFASASLITYKTMRRKASSDTEKNSGGK